MLLLAGPLVLSAYAKSYRAPLFAVINVALYAFCLKTSQELCGLVLIISIPMIYEKLVKRFRIPLWPIVSVTVLLFILLSGYPWLFGSYLHDKVLHSVKILGLSYILFREIDVILLVQAEKIKSIRLLDYLNYLFSFYTIMAGPIQRYRDFVESFYRARPITEKKEILRCFHRAANGMLKILLVAAFCKDLSDNFYSGLMENGLRVDYLLGIFYAYPLYVYFNFSGYCDVVIAMASWAGFVIPENFERPYLARNMIDFWNRWHITLSSWLRDFVYQPLFKYLLSGPLSRHLFLAQYLSIFVTFFLAGIWHGTTINFVVFGLLHGSGMALSMIYRDGFTKIMGKKRFNSFRERKTVGLLEIAVTLHFVCFTFLFFEYDVGKMTFWLTDLAKNPLKYILGG